MIEWIRKVYSTMMLDLLQFFRYRMAVLSTVLTPFVMILAFGLGMGKTEYLIEGEPYIHFILPGILGIGTMFSCIYSAGYSILMDRQKKLIEDIVLSPVSYSVFIVGRITSNILKSFIQFLISIVVAIAFLKVPLNHPVILMISFIITAVYFAAIGIIVASFTNMISFGGFANLITLPFMYFCGVFFPITKFKELALLLVMLPFTASLELFRYSLLGKCLIGNVASHMATVVFYSVILVFIGIFSFKRSVITH